MSILIVISLLYLHLLMFFILLLFFIHIFFSTSSLTFPWTIAGFLHPFHTFSPAHRRVICDTFIFNHSFIFLPQLLRTWVGVFYPQVFFTWRSFTDILTCVYQAFPGSQSRQFFLEVCEASYWSSKQDPVHLFVWLTVIHKLPIQNDSVLNSIIYDHELLVVKV